MPNSSSSRDSIANERGKLNRVFDAASLGASFQTLAVDVVSGETTDFTSRWFRARLGEADLVIWTDGEKRIIKHQLCFYGQVVEWNPIHGTRTGLIVEEETLESTSGEKVAVSEMIQFDPAVQSDVVKQAVSVLQFIPEINDADRSHLIYNLKHSPKLHKNARERALKAWAPKIEEIHSNRRPTFWKRLKTWVLGD